MIDCLFINPPFNRIPVDYYDDASLSRFKMDAINPGIMSMALYLKKNNIKCDIIDLYREFDWDTITSLIREKIVQTSPAVVALSNLSAFDYIDCIEIVRFIQSQFPTVEVVMGGQHTSGLNRDVFRDLPELKYIVVGEGEYAIRDIVLAVKYGNNIDSVGNLWINQSGAIHRPCRTYPPFDLNQLPTIDFSIYPNAISYTPYIEESRGCSFNCEFCNNKQMYGQRVRNKSLKRFREDVEATVSFFGRDKLYAILNSDLCFGTSIDKADILKGYGIKWSTQMDCLHNWSEKVPIFKESGMFLLNIGVESGSYKILAEMNKTKNPKQYLKNCKETIEKCKEYGIESRINIMLYPGESTETIKETLKFLNDIKDSLSAVVCCTTIAYPGSELFNNLSHYEEKYGTSKVITEYCNKTHHYPLNLSPDIDFKRATEIALGIEEDYSSTRILSTVHNYKKYEEEFLK